MYIFISTLGGGSLGQGEDGRLGFVGGFFALSAGGAADVAPHPAELPGGPLPVP